MRHNFSLLPALTPFSLSIPKVYMRYLFYGKK